MKKILVNFYTCIIVLLSFNADGQMTSYSYSCELDGISDEWHKIVLPNEIFEKVNSNFSDIRIYGITTDSDTIEAPYLIRQAKDKVVNKEVAFKSLNVSYNDEGHFFTLEIPRSEAINKINLDFDQENFDWRIKLEGSQDQREWYTIIEDYRILSIKNKITDYQFTTLSFPSSKYRYFRLLVHSNEKPDLSKVSIAHYEIEKGEYRDYSFANTKITENKTAKQTEIEITLPLEVPVNQLQIDVGDDFDYYRPITIQYLNDSIHTEKGWKYNYRTLTSSVLSSIDGSEFNFDSKILSKLKVIIHNHDNQALSIDSVIVSGYVHEIVARFTEPAKYSLTYGRPDATKPNYDIDRFANKIPEELSLLALSPEKSIKKSLHNEKQPLFKSKIWLWVIMGFIILVLGGFSLRMMRDVG